MAIKDIVEIDKNANDSNSSDTNDNDANIAIKAEVLILKHNWKRPKLRQQEYDARNRYFSRIVLMVSDCNKIRIAFIFFNCCKAIYPKIVLLFLVSANHNHMDSIFFSGLKKSMADLPAL